MRLRHYGASAFNPKLFRPIEDHVHVKPKGGLWTSPIDSEYGWCHWCVQEGFRQETISGPFFDLTFTGKVLVIDSLADLDKLPWAGFGGTHFEFPLFQPLVLMGVDAVHLTVRGQEETRLSFPHNLYGWDCESVLVMNLKCITPISS